MTPKPRIRMASLDDIGFGPDKLPYREALEREYAKQPQLPGSTMITNEKLGRKSAQPVAPPRRRRYDKSLHHIPPTKEGNMPRKPAAAPVEEVEENGSKDLISYGTKPISIVGEALANWTLEATDLEIPADPEEAFRRGVYLAISLRRDFQHDEDHDAIVEDVRATREAAKPAKASKAADEEEEGEGEEAPAKAPARRGRKPAAAATASTSSTSKTGAAPARGRKPAAGTASTSRSTGRTRGSKATAAAGAAKGEAPF